MMQRTPRHRLTAIAGAMAALTLLSGCSSLQDVKITNSCGVAVQVGEGNDTIFWTEFADGQSMIMSAAGWSKYPITVLPVDAPRAGNPTEIDLGDLESTNQPGDVPLYFLDLAEQGLCP